MEKQLLIKLEKISKEYLENEEKSKNPNIFSDFKKLKEIEGFLKKNQEIYFLFSKYQTKLKEIQEINKILAEEKNKEELIDFKFLLESGEEELNNIEDKLQDLLIVREPEDVKNAIVEIKGAVGGEEANIFAADLFEMYKKFALKNNFKIEVNEEIKSEMGGYSFISFLIKGNGAYGLFRYESGVHRVQRVPVTESSGRVHTSTATVLVVPEADEFELNINPSDLRIDTYRSSGAGGQHVNTTDSAVRITHLPTGIVASSQDGRSQHDNKDKAMRILQSKIYDYKIKEENKKYSENKRNIIGSAERSEKIRTYNYPQNRITDHRINLTLKKLNHVMNGNLEEIISLLNKIYYEK